MKTFIVTGGGTGGHLAIARALAAAIKARGDRAVFIGSTAGQDRRWFDGTPDFDRTFFLSTTGVVNRRGWRKAAALWRVAAAAVSARAILRESGACGVISVGGFSAAPAAFAAVMSGVPLFIHEQNAVAGRLNRLLRPRARLFFSAYDDASPVKDYPVAKRLFDTARLRTKVETVIFLGGSQGARAINAFALEAAPMLRERGISIIHQCGEAALEATQAAYEALGIDAEVYGFTDDLPALLERADTAVSRAGASTLWELAANGLPTLFVPYPYAAGDHQYYNAQHLAEHGLGAVVREEALTLSALETFLDGGIETMSRGLMALGGDDAAARIVETIAKECR